MQCAPGKQVHSSSLEFAGAPSAENKTQTFLFGETLHLTHLPLPTTVAF
jgi:hypothetical protein